MGSIGAKQSTKAPDEFGGLFGDREAVNSQDRITMLMDSAVNIINPNRWTGGEEYSKNCALCAVAVALQARGYDVEAMPRDKDQWRGLDSVFDVDYSNPDNYFTSGTRYRMSGVPSKSTIVNNSYYGAYSNRINDYEVPTAPRGANAVANAIIKKAEKWGNGAVGVLNVKWKNSPSAHALNVVNVNGVVYGYDAQSNTLIPNLHSYMKRTIAQRTSLVRLDNAPIREDINKNDLAKMVKRRK